MAFINLCSWKESPQHLGRQRSLWEDRGGVAVFCSSPGHQTVRGACALQKEFGVTCVWWSAAMTMAFPKTDAPSAVRSWSPAFS